MDQKLNPRGRDEGVGGVLGLEREDGNEYTRNFPHAYYVYFFRQIFY